MKKYILNVSFIIFFLFQFNISFAVCSLINDNTEINVNGKYNISGIFACEKINLSDYADDCEEEQTNVFWWNGTKWKEKAMYECRCNINTECESNFCFNGICNYPVSSFYPVVSFDRHIITAPKNKLIKNIIEINNTLNLDDVFDVKIMHDETNDAQKIWKFSYIEEIEAANNNKVNEYKIKANSSKKIMLVSKGISENINGNLSVTVTSRLTGFSDYDTAKYTITKFNKKNFFQKDVPDINATAFFFTFLITLIILYKKQENNFN